MKQVDFPKIPQHRERSAVLLLLLLSAAMFLMRAGSASASGWFPDGNTTWAAQVSSRSNLQPGLRLDWRMLSDADDSPPTVQTDTATKKKVSRSRYAVPALFSAILPGSGEIATGHIWNGIPLLAAEVAIWFGYFHFNDEGNQLRSDYEVFVDAHWTFERWQTNQEANFNEANGDPYPNWWNPEFPYNCDCSPPYIPKEVDLQEYYENAGKYRHFRSGWDDWQYNPNNPLGSDSRSNRAEYISMRNRSNNDFDNAGTMLGLAVLTRAISVAQTLWLVRRDLHREDLQLKPTYSRGRGAGMKLTWSY